MASWEEQMERKGLVYAQHRPGKPPRYQAIGYLVGIYEFPLNKLTPELVKDFQEYSSTWFDLDVWKKGPQIRTIPVGNQLKGMENSDETKRYAIIFLHKLMCIKHAFITRRWVRGNNKTPTTRAAHVNA
jgi:hypothetical protein